MPNMRMDKNPMPEQCPNVRNKNFLEVTTGYTEEMAIDEAQRCPQEKQCESKCVRGIKGESVGIGRLERFVADWHMKNVKEEIEKPVSNGKRVAVVGSGP